MRKIALLKHHLLTSNGYELDLADPRTFNAKIQWLKLFYHDPALARIADKHEVKEFVRERLGDGHTIPTLAILDSSESYRCREWPAPHVVKLTNGSGKVLFCHSYEDVDETRTRALLDDWLRPAGNQYSMSAEWCYRDLPSRLIVEPMIGRPEELPDYKVFCFDGEPRSVMMCTERATGLKVDFFDIDWTPFPFRRLYPRAGVMPAKPAALDEMLEQASVLARGFPFLRVDFYLSDGRPLVGELTAYPGNGTEPFYPREWDERFGEWLRLPDTAIVCPRPPAPTVRIPRRDLSALLAELDDDRGLSGPTSGPSPEVQAEIARLVDKIRRMQSSWSWRLTAPFRALRRACLPKS